MRIAIVGTGIAGLCAARVLSRRHDITVFEAADRIGGHTHTVPVEEGGRVIPVDTGFIVFNRENYPNLCRLFDELGVASRASDMSFSVHCERTGTEYNGSSPGQVFAQRANLLRPAFWGMLRDILRFHDDARLALQRGLPDTETVAGFVAARGYGTRFMEHYLEPLGASLWSCPAQRFRRFPMRFVLDFLSNHRMLQVQDRPVWRTVCGGSSAYIAPLVAPFAARILTATPVTRVRREGRGVCVHTATGRAGYFDEVVLATHADQSLALLADADREERALLHQFPYQRNEAVLHTDTGRLPDRRAAWASWNYRIPATPGAEVAVTYNMNMLQGLDAAATYCVSLNQGHAIRPETVLRRIVYQHPVFQPGRDAAQGRHGEFIRRRGVSLCGAWWGYGFHEDGVRSGLAVGAAFDLELAA